MAAWLALWVCGAVGQAAEIQRVALEIVEPAERHGVTTDFPVAVGLVFPAGELASAHAGAVVDDRGAAVAFEAEATSWWSPEKTSVKWLLLRFRASTNRRYFFDPAGRPRPPAGAPLATADAAGVRINTGPLAARLAQSRGQLFEEITLNGKAVVAAGGLTPALVTDDGPCTLGEWTVALEENSPARAVVRTGGFFLDPRQTKVARLDVRMEFFRGESFARLQQTLTWMVRDPKVGVRELSLRLTPRLPAVRALIGLSAYTSESFAVSLDKGARVAAFQDRPDHFDVRSGESTVRDGKHLGGWMTREDGAGAGVGICLRHAWQMFPSGLEVAQGELRVNLWPAAAGRMGFDYADLMPPDLYYKKNEWSQYPWSTDAGHFEHEYGKHPGYVHTAEGAARTHELTLHFFDRSSRRTTAELNSLLQHPLALRQEPRHAMRVPFMGFNLSAADWEHYPDVERAIEQIGRMVTARWSQIHDYGWWRFGMIRWAAPTPYGSLYRWFDGTQYDLQLVPWLLWLRGGGREFFEEGEITARFAMDVATNHYNTRGAPTGYMAGAGGMPFPWAAHHLHKAQKIHFLAYAYHLTGYPRAKEVMAEVIAGTKREALDDPQPNPVNHRGWGRELYNMCVFWANAYEETWDPQIKAFGREWFDLAINREFSPQLSEFRNPQIYLYNGLVIQQRLGADPRASQVMLKNLAHHGYPTLDDGGIWAVESTIACDWAYEQTKDPRFASVAWDVARALADLVPDYDWRSTEVPRYPYQGNQLYRHLLLPILVGNGLAAKQGLLMNAPMARRDAYIAIDAGTEKAAAGEARVRARHDGDLPVRILLTTRTQKPSTPVKVTAFDATGGKCAETTLTLRPAAETKDRHFDPHWWFTEATLTLQDARAGTTYTLRFEGDGKECPMVLVLADASIVHRFDPGRLVDSYQEAGQYFAGARLFIRTAAETVRIDNGQHEPLTIRDAGTGELLFRSSMSDPPQMEHKLGRDRLVFLTVRGRQSALRLQGFAPWIAATREGWFDPDVK